MNIEKAKAILIAKILERLELKSVKESNVDATYHSPFRKERTPSFHVHKRDNVWYDHGEGIGGNAFDLVLKILEKQGLSHKPVDGLRWIRNCHLDPDQLQPRDPVKNKESKWKVLDIMPLEDLALTRYLNQRGIDVNIAKRFVQEIYVRKKCSLTKMYAIGIQNEDGGYELRNKFVKSAVSPKTITFIRGDQPKPPDVMVFEGFMDFLSYATVQKGALPCDNIILNSVACVDHAIRYIKNYGYSFVYTWMDNDKAGEKAKQRLDEFIKSEPNLTHKPMNYVYAKHKDLNAMHMHVLNL